MYPLSDNRRGRALGGMVHRRQAKCWRAALRDEVLLAVRSVSCASWVIKKSRAARLFRLALIFLSGWPSLHTRGRGNGAHIKSAVVMVSVLSLGHAWTRTASVHRSFAWVHEVVQGLANFPRHVDGSWGSPACHNRASEGSRPLEPFQGHPRI